MDIAHVAEDVTAIAEKGRSRGLDRLIGDGGSLCSSHMPSGHHGGCNVFVIVGQPSACSPLEQLAIIVYVCRDIHYEEILDVSGWREEIG